MKDAWYRWKAYVTYENPEENTPKRRLPKWKSVLRVTFTLPVMVFVTIISIPVQGFFRFMDAVAR